METHSAPRIISAERLDGGVIVTFSDGKCAIFQAELLYSILSQATEVDNESEET